MKTERTKVIFLFIVLTSFLSLNIHAQEKKTKGIFLADTSEIVQQIQNMPFIEVGKGVSFAPRTNSSNLRSAFACRINWPCSSMMISL